MVSTLDVRMNVTAFADWKYLRFGAANQDYRHDTISFLSQEIIKLNIVHVWKHYLCMKVDNRADIVHGDLNQSGQWFWNSTRPNVIIILGIF